MGLIINSAFAGDKEITTMLIDNVLVWGKPIIDTVTALTFVDADYDFPTSTGFAKISWTATANALADASYLIYKANLAGVFEEVDVVSAPTLDWTDTDVKNDKSYQYRIKVIDTAGNESDFSEIISVPIPNLVLSTMGKPTTTNFGVNTMRVTWTAPTGGSYPTASFSIRLGGVEVGVVNDGAATTFLHGMAADRRYKYTQNAQHTVVAIDTQGNVCNPSPLSDGLSYGMDWNPLHDAGEWPNNGNNRLSTFNGIYKTIEVNGAGDGTFFEFNGDYGTDIMTGAENMEMTCRLETSDGTSAFILAVRFVDVLNFIGLRPYLGNVEIYEKVGGTWNKLMETPNNLRSQMLTLRVVGSQVTFLVNGTERWTGTTAVTGSGRAGILSRDSVAMNLSSIYSLHRIIGGAFGASFDNTFGF